MKFYQDKNNNHIFFWKNLGEFLGHLTVSNLLEIALPER